MSGMHDQIADLEAEIEALSEAADRCGKIGVAARAAIGIGGMLLLIAPSGLIPLGPAGVVASIAAVVGGIALFGSNRSTRDGLVARIGALEARRAQLIDSLSLEDVDGAP